MFRRTLLISILVLLAASAGWFVSDAVEANNDFCTACHLPDGNTLHSEIRAGFDASPVYTLAAVHREARVAVEGGERSFRCIDCHAGVGFVGRAKVKLLASKDALVWLAGDFDEPDQMQFPLGEADCRQCHVGFAAAQKDEDEALRFHALAVHNADLGVNCVECHTVHDGGGDEQAFFLNAPVVREQCGRCHSQFQEGSK
ncbi:MAG: hypothetical protein GY944_30125 [bacterium]|nr:hypothetical protein [bacterium]